MSDVAVTHALPCRAKLRTRISVKPGAVAACQKQHSAIERDGFQVSLFALHTCQAVFRRLAGTGQDQIHTHVLIVLS